MNAESLDSRDLERLHDETVHLEQHNILTQTEADQIRAQLTEIADANGCGTKYNLLISAADRQVVDLSRDTRAREWLLDAYEDLLDFGLIVESLREELKARSLNMLEIDIDFLYQEAGSALGLSVRTMNGLEDHHFPWTVRELTESTPTELLACKNFGDGCLAEVRDKLREHNLKLADD